MKKKIKYTDGPIGKTKVIKDFLPAPEELIFKDKNVKVTLNLKESSVAYFKYIARSHKTQYQKVTRNLLDKYASHFQRA